MKSKKPEISVILPIYNVEEFLARALDSLLSQTFEDFEAICIDDGSPDGSKKILRKYAAKDSRIKIFSQSNRGVSAARNTGLAKARGQYVYFMDPDDYIHPQLLEIAHFFASKHHAKIVSFGCYYTGKYAGDFHIYGDLHRVEFTVTENPLAHFCTGCEPNFNSAIWSKLYRRDILAGAKFLPGIHYSEDTLFNLGIATRKPLTILIKERLYFYFENQNSVVQRPVSEKQIADFHKSILKILELFDNEYEHQVWKCLFSDLRRMLRKIRTDDVLNRARLESEFAKIISDLGRAGWLRVPAMSIGTIAWVIRLRKISRRAYPKGNH